VTAVVSDAAFTAMGPMVEAATPADFDGSPAYRYLDVTLALLEPALFLAAATAASAGLRIEPFDLDVLPIDINALGCSTSALQLKNEELSKELPSPSLIRSHIWVITYRP
jgi:hypothetical protein